MADLEVTGVRLGEPQPQGPRDPVTGEQAEFIDVVITLHNSTDHPLHVISGVRRILYDSATDTLTLRLDDEVTSPQYTPTHVFPPDFREIGPGESVELTVPVPADLKRITGATPQGVAVEQYDVRRTQHVVVSVAHAAEPFQLDTSDPPDVLRRRLATWGGRTEVAIRPQRERRAGRRGQEDDDAIPR